MAMMAQTIKPINKRAAAMSPIKCQSVRAPRNPIVLRDSAISSSDIHATTKSSRFSRHRVPWAIAPSHARWPWPSARRISRPSRAAFYVKGIGRINVLNSVSSDSLTYAPVTCPLTSWHKPQTNRHQEHYRPPCRESPPVIGASPKCESSPRSRPAEGPASATAREGSV